MTRQEDIDNFLNGPSSVAGQIRSIPDYFRYNRTSDESKISAYSSQAVIDSPL